MFPPRIDSSLPRNDYIVGCLCFALLATSCLEKVVQTAEVGAPARVPISCGDAPAPGPPSWNELLGTDDEVADSLFSGGEYGEGQGPGISVAAWGSYRIYLNGQLLHEMNEARASSFVPLTLAPGTNVVTVTVSAESGVPAALVELNELARDYVSDRQWKASRTPDPGWQANDYDDSNWSNAEELADRGELPGCDPESGFPASSSSRWIGLDDSSEGPLILRRTIRIAAAGFGAETTGGEGAVPVVAATWNELVAAVASDDPKVVVIEEGNYDFRRSGSELEDVDVCATECPSVPGKSELEVLLDEVVCETPLVTVQRYDRKLSIGSNTTIVGLGRGALIRGVTFDFSEKENIIVRNVALYDINAHLLEAGDAFGLTQPERIWIDHGSVKWASDGFTDIRQGSRNVTLSYMHYDAANEAACDGQHRWTSEITDAEVTIHHSRFDRASSRAPFIAGAESRVHLFNNVFSNISDWSVGSSCLAQVLLEGNTFENVEAATMLGGCAETGELGLVNAPAGSNLYRGGSSVYLGADGNEPRDDVFQVPYEYQAEPANDAWPVVISRAGTGGPWALPMVRD